MKTVGKALLYVLFLGLAVVFFGRFRDEYARTDAGPRRLERAEGMRDGDTANTAQTALTNSAVTVNGQPNSSPDTNALELANGGKAGPVAGQTQSSSGSSKGPLATSAKPNRSALYLAGFVGGMLGLALLLGWDVTQWVSRKTTHGLGVDLAPVENDLEYDAAEMEWTKGNHLDAIKLLRDFLKHNPSHLHAAIRIAEIYEKDLHNYLAAALELEEVLTKRLPREKWGWTAIHLANIYSGRMNQPDKALATLDRIVRDFPETSAAKKARQRLGIPDPEKNEPAQMAEENLPAESEPEPENPSMPKGFKPRKR